MLKRFLQLSTLFQTNKSYFVPHGSPKPTTHFYSDNLASDFLSPGLSLGINGPPLKHRQIFGENCGRVQGLKGSQAQEKQGGTTLKEPWHAIVQIEIFNSGFSYCGGVIIHQNYVLTAGSCLLTKENIDKCQYEKRKSNNFCVEKLRGHVLYGTEEFKNTKSNQNVHQFSNDFVSEIKSFKIHERFGMLGTSRNKNDIAILKVTRISMNIDKFHQITPICLPTRDYCVKDGEELLATGLQHGTGNKKESSGSSLKTVKVPVWPITDCKVALEFGSTIGYSAPAMVCARNLEDNRKDCLNADDGSPLVHMSEFESNNTKTKIATLYGISSLSWDCHGLDQDMPGFYTRISNYLDWIQKVTGVVSDDVFVSAWQARRANNGQVCDDSYNNGGNRASWLEKEVDLEDTEHTKQETKTQTQKLAHLKSSINLPPKQIVINKKFPSSAIEIITNQLENNLEDSQIVINHLLNHGCWCSKLDISKGHQDNSGGQHAVDEIDGICRNWANARQCNRLDGGSCFGGEHYWDFWGNEIKKIFF